MMNHIVSDRLTAIIFVRKSGMRVRNMKADSHSALRTVFVMAIERTRYRG